MRGGWYISKVPVSRAEQVNKSEAKLSKRPFKVGTEFKQGFKSSSYFHSAVLIWYLHACIVERPKAPVTLCPPTVNVASSHRWMQRKE